MTYLYKLAAIVLLLVAMIQWCGVGERIIHAIIQWVKFRDDIDGHTTISYSMAVVTYVLSGISIMIALFLATRAGENFVSISGKISGTSLLIGVISLSVLLVSPLGELVTR